MVPYGHRWSLPGGQVGPTRKSSGQCFRTVKAFLTVQSLLGLEYGQSLSRRSEPLQATCCCFELDKSTQETSESGMERTRLSRSFSCCASSRREEFMCFRVLLVTGSRGNGRAMQSSQAAGRWLLQPGSLPLEPCRNWALALLLFVKGSSGELWIQIPSRSLGGTEVWLRIEPKREGLS